MTVQLPAGKESVFSLRPWHTVSSLTSSFKDEDSTVTSASLHLSNDQNSTTKWAGLSNVEDVLRAGLRVRHQTQSQNSSSNTTQQSDPGFYLELNGQMIRVDMPTFEGIFINPRTLC